MFKRALSVGVVKLLYSSAKHTWSLKSYDHLFPTSAASIGNKVKSGKSYLFWGLDENYRSVAIVGLGKKDRKSDANELIDHVKENARIAAAVGCNALKVTEIDEIDVESFEDAEAAAEGSRLSTWKFQDFKTKKEKLPKLNLFTISSNDQSKWDRGIIKADSQNIVRRLADMPANMMTPTIFAENIGNIFEARDVRVDVHGKEWAEKQNMNAFLAVAKGSIEPPKFVEITYNPNKANSAPIVLVGKGVTFDSGGISLKPAASMDEMRADMAGAASLVGVLDAIAKLKIDVNLRILLPLVENMPSGNAIKPGDVITAKNGKSICVDNTDAEGRLILADALCYGSSCKPRWMLDVATLTGAMRVALGNSATGVFTNSDTLYSKLQTAAAQSGDRVWRFPLWKHYRKLLTENAAYDLNNIGKAKGGGSCTAAAFLNEFVSEGINWLHLDIAGVMGPDDNTPYLGKGMTGRPTRTLIEFVTDQARY